MKFLKESCEIGIFRLFQCLIKGNSITEEGVTVSISNFEHDELVLMVNLDIERHHMPCLKHFVSLNSSVALADILLIYARKVSKSIRFKFFLLELGKHTESELENKEKGSQHLFQTLGLSINPSKTFVIYRSRVHTLQFRNKRYEKIRPNDLLKKLRGEI